MKDFHRAMDKLAKKLEEDESGKTFLKALSVLKKLHPGRK
jgi:hypothetical protein